METRQMTPFENSQNSFSCGPPLVHSGLQNTSILGKSYRFGQPIILLSKSLLCFVPLGEPKKGISSWTTGIKITAGIYLFNVNNKNTKTLVLVSTANFEQFLHLILVFLLLTLNR